MHRQCHKTSRSAATTGYKGAMAPKAQRALSHNENNVASPTLITEEYSSKTCLPHLQNRSAALVIAGTSRVHVRRR